MAREVQVSPRGEALWAKVLGEPVAFEDNPRAWSVTLVLDPSDPETIAFTEKLEGIFTEFHGPSPKMSRNGWPFGEQTTTDEKGRRVPTGKVEFRFKRKEVTNRGNTKQPPVVVDAKKNRWPEDKLIGNGSKVKVAFSAWPWDMAGAKGMSLELEMLQVLDLVEYERNVDPFDEEDGYEVPPEVETPFQKEGKPSSFSDQLRARAAEVKAEAPIVMGTPDADEIPF